MSNRTTKRAARSLGGMVMNPPITREAAIEYLGAEITVESWSAICRAFAQYGRILEALKASRTSKAKDPEKASWHERQRTTVKALETVLDRLNATRKHGNFLCEASDNYTIARFGYSRGSDFSADKMLNDAYHNVLHALTIIERAEPMNLEVPTEANARATLVRDIAHALEQDGIEGRASTGFALYALTRPPRLSDLTQFEQLIDALGIGEEMTVLSFSALVRSALREEKGG